MAGRPTFLLHLSPRGWSVLGHGGWPSRNGCLTPSNCRRSISLAKYGAGRGSAHLLAPEEPRLFAAAARPRPNRSTTSWSLSGSVGWNSSRWYGSHLTTSRAAGSSPCGGGIFPTTLRLWTCRSGSPTSLTHHDSSRQGQRHRPMFLGARHSSFTPLTPEEEEEEKQRVALLTPLQKDEELRQYNRQLARLEKLKAINTGELYTWTGRYKALARDYGFPLMVWYWSVWGGTAVLCYTAMEVGGVDAITLLASFDAWWPGWDLSDKVNPEYGKIGLALVINELIEPIRLPVVILTVKPVMDRIFPPKY